MRTEGTGYWEGTSAALLTLQKSQEAAGRTELSVPICASFSYEQQYVFLLDLYHEPMRLGLVSFRKTGGKGTLETHSRSINWSLVWLVLEHSPLGCKYGSCSRCLSCPKAAPAAPAAPRLPQLPQLPLCSRVTQPCLPSAH